MVFRRRKSRSRRMNFSRRVRHRSRGSSSGGGISFKELELYTGLYAAARPYAVGIIPDGFMGLPPQYTENIILGGIGFLGAWKGQGMVKKAGMVTAAGETFVGVSKFLAGMKTSNTSSGSSPNGDFL